MEQRLNGEYLRPGLFDRAAALAIGALGVGTGILLAAWGISFLWRYTPPDVEVRIANPEVLLKQSEPLKVSQDKPFTIIQSEPFKVDSATVTVKADHIPAIAGSYAHPVGRRDQTRGYSLLIGRPCLGSSYNRLDI